MAREVLRELATGKEDGDLTVFYFANSLGLRAQNRRSLARAEAENLSIELIKQDRLGLAATLKVMPGGCASLSRAYR
ncbi:hypothetical protein [Ferrovibrio sp.]|uniref:hypothetical protein n=1 Tax=Ferrovibrio sp. TaxID=1917215 RepID=UPI0035B41111